MNSLCLALALILSLSAFADSQAPKPRKAVDLSIVKKEQALKKPSGTGTSAFSGGGASDLLNSSKPVDPAISEAAREGDMRRAAEHQRAMRTLPAYSNTGNTVEIPPGIIGAPSAK